MIRALLLDLDDTLLINDWDTFYRPYIALLLNKVKGLVPPESFIRGFNLGTRAMMRNDGSSGCNRDAFFKAFFAEIDAAPEDVLPLLHNFYERDFQALGRYTAQDPQAPVLLQTAADAGIMLALATQPVFPAEAIHARMRWAGVGPEQFDYACVADYERQGACKPHPSYFALIIDHLDVESHECLMVGDNIQSDMPAADLGCKTFFVERRQQAPADLACSASGDLAELTALIRTGAIHEL